VTVVSSGGRLEGERWSSQTTIWTERQRGRALYWPAGEGWFANDPLGPHPHTHPDASEIYLVAQGTLELTVGREELVMTAGDYCLIPPDTFHHPRNGGRDDLGLFVVVAPNWRDRRWKPEGFSEPDFLGVAAVGSTAGPGPLPGDRNIAAAVVAAPSEESCDPLRERAIYVLAGEVEVEIGPLAGRLAEHEYVHVPAGARHTLRDAGDGPARILSVWTPATS
jgi:quercetin dioxygenase-like cupin family protein